MAYTQTDLDRIEAQIAAVEKAVRFGDRSVDYRPLDELIKQRDIIQNALNVAGDGASIRSTYASFSKD
jgi:hypothetical protein